MILKKIFENLLLGFFSFRRNSKTFLIFNLFLLLFIFDISKADTNNSTNSNNNNIEIEYLELLPKQQTIDFVNQNRNLEG